MQLKHLFVFLLIFLLSVAESTIYCQESSSAYYQSSKIIQHKKTNYKNTKIGAFNQHLISGKNFLALFFPETSLKFVIRKQILLTLKLQKQLHQEIALLHNQQIFLINKNITSNSISKIYIA